MKDQALYDRLVAKVRKDVSGCWIWTGAAWTNRKYAANRYGYISIWLTEKKKTRTYGTHRAMWIALHGTLTKDEHVCHECDVPLCINPEHLFLGNHDINMADSKRKGRHFLSSKTHCKRGHPLSGENLYFDRGLRHCKLCQRGMYRKRLGWPDHLAFSDYTVPHGYRLDRTTLQIVPGRGRNKATA